MGFVNFKIEQELKEKLKEIGKKTQRSLSGVIRVAILEYLERNKEDK